MSTLTEVGDRADWRCWLCDEPVDPDMSVNDPRGPSIDAVTSEKPKKGAPVQERLAHRSCNTRKGAVKAVVPWPSELFVIDPAPIVETADRLSRKGGREIVARCPTRDDAEQAGAWLVDRLSRLAPQLPVSTTIQPGGGQFLLAVTTR
jgi:hypothetical protein